ncbi:MAG TPA: cytochrome c3 family protein [Gemmatimonadales bacterium]|nr:cytochrome c3 family protein [Gemmatimonadales bacterium]
MPSPGLPRRSALLVLGLLALVLGGCSSEKLVFRQPFNPPPDANAKFLGYFTTSEKQTTCGNCHVEKQADWTTTKHSQAWSDLVASGHQDASCNSCHSVSEKGNATTGPAGYSAVPDTVYQDVQCESCHGPGFDHASSPTLQNRPLAQVGVPTDPAAWDASASCGSCHTGDFSPFVEQWSQSAHARTVPEVIEEVAADPAGAASCAACHEGRNVLRAWGVNTNFVEKADVVTEANAMPTTCAVCHDPHAKDHEGQLRFAIDNPDPNQNLCMKCHNRRIEPQATSPRGPHAPQGGVLMGSAGYWPAGFDTTAVLATHGNPSVNTRLCAGCHVAPFTVTNATGNVVFQSVGHLFNPDPCLDPDGKPLADNSCPHPGEPAYASGSRKFNGCAASGCHSSETAAENAFEANRSVIRTLADQLWVDANGNQVLYDTTTAADPGGSGLPKAFDPGDTGLLTQVPVDSFNYKDLRVTDEEGVLFNLRLIAEGRYANGDGSFGVHNPFLAQSLLTASIDVLKAKYGLAVTPKVQAILDRVNARVLQQRKQVQVSAARR